MVTMAWGAWLALGRRLALDQSARPQLGARSSRRNHQKACVASGTRKTMTTRRRARRINIGLDVRQAGAGFKGEGCRTPPLILRCRSEAEASKDASRLRVLRGSLRSHLSMRRMDS